MLRMFIACLLLLPQGHTPIDLARQVHSPLLIHMLTHIKQERTRSNSRCLRFINSNRVIREPKSAGTRLLRASE